MFTTNFYKYDEFAEKKLLHQNRINTNTNQVCNICIYYPSKNDVNGIT